MAKSFNTNVATNWISQDIQAAAQTETKEVTAEKTTETVEKTDKTAEKSSAAKETSKKETAEKKEPAAKKAKSEGVTLTFVAKEKKTVLKSFLLTETNCSKLQALAKKNGLSLNSCLNQILEQVL